MISSFKGEYAFLSNFYPCRIELDADFYPSVEHAYQASKSILLPERIWIRHTSGAGHAKQKGQFVTLREDWNDPFRLSMMLQLLRRKFAIPELRRRLLETGDQDLIEGNWWGDAFWGVPQGPLYKGLGENHLGKLLMQVRSEIQKQEVDANAKVIGEVAWG